MEQSRVSQSLFFHGELYVNGIMKKDILACHGIVHSDSFMFSRGHELFGSI